MTASRVLLLLSAAASAALLAGCGGDALSFDPVANAATKTADTQSSRVEFTATTNIDGVGGMAFSGSGMFDGRTHSGMLDLRYELPPDVQAQLGGAAPTMQMIMDGRRGLVLYMRSPLLARVAGDRWIKFDMQKVAKKEGIDLEALLKSSQADPSQMLGMLQASTRAKPVSYDHVRGVFTTHYTFDVDLARLAKQNKELRSSLNKIRELTGVSSYPAEAWIDDAGRVRRLKIDMSFNTPTGGAFTMSLTEDLYAFGVKVDVRPPASRDVLDAGALIDG